MSETLLRREARGKVEGWLFEKHSFLSTVIIVWIFAIPWLVCFFPGTLEPDARHQLLMAFGFAPTTGHHPVMATKIMGKCVSIGQFLFDSDTIGVFIYTILQFLIQSLVFAYTAYVLDRLKPPYILRWGTLLFYAVFPLFPMWGFTMVKDTGYYIFMLLFVVTLVHVLHEESGFAKWWQILLLVVSAAGGCCYRKDGYTVVLVTLLCCFVAHKKYRKFLVFGMVSCLSCTLLINGVLMSVENIPKGSVKEAMSIPLQQTARYVWEHYDEITPEEMEVLESVFTVEIEELAMRYFPELSDPVKYVFVDYPDSEDLKAYFGVWWQQFLKHPGTYIQAFLNHCYGYFYPSKSISWDGEDIGIFEIAWSAQLDINFGIEDDTGRIFLEQYSRFVKRIPVIGMLYSVGLHTWILLGCVAYLLAKRKWKDLILYVPAVCILAVCILSPVNTCVRYMLPIMALLPVHLGWLTRKREKNADESQFIEV